MWVKCWTTVALLVALGLSGTGCSFPVRQASNDGGSRWNPFDRPKAMYTAMYSEQTATEDELPLKQITDPNPLKLRYALWMEETGNLPEARKHYTEVLAARPKEIEAVLGLARIDLATDHNDPAEQGFRRALKLDPHSAIAHSGLGQCRAAAQDWPAAVEELTEASRGLPEDKTIRYHLAVALVHTDDLAAAQVQFSHCVGEAAGHYNTALILKDQGQLAEAESQLELALRKDPNFKDAERWLTELRKARSSPEQALMRGPAEIQPAVKQVSYQDYGQIGTVDFEPAVYVTEAALPALERAAGHSTSRQ